MDGLKELVQYGNELAKPNFELFGQNYYSDKKMYRLDENTRAEALEVSTLSSLVSYIKSKVDATEKMIVQVVSPTEVKFLSVLDNDRKREELLCAQAQIPSFSFERYMSNESFTIALQSKFLDTDDRPLLLQFAGTVESGTVSQYSDDGISQKATIKNGVASKTDAIIPSPAKLKPFRTFMEVEQPSSDFIFRMRDGGGNVECALFEADGGAWKNQAMSNIHKYLEFELADMKDKLIIIS